MAGMAITSVQDCVSDEEKKQRFGVTVVNVFVWLMLAIMVVSSMGVMLLFFGFGWLMNSLLSEFNVRRLEALGTAVSPRQLPEVHQAASEVCQRFGLQTMPRIIVLNSAESNAFSMRFARKKVVLIFSELLEGIIDNPAQLRFLIAHEACHGVLDQGARGVFEVYKPARYRQARELTCDNAGLAAGGDLREAKEVLKKLCIGRHLFGRLAEEPLIADAERINSGFAGWLLRQYLTHPPAGARLCNMTAFQSKLGSANLTAPSLQRAAFDSALLPPPLSPVPPLPPIAPRQSAAPTSESPENKSVL